ncbi:hypothetical protein HJFPF1_13210 [Paramyrothecium foliicola]|nr:hypothetical protein HJFPF1_13210 [Paramyrothecium foliicola]
MPTRVLEIQPQSETFRIVRSESLEARAPYVALSHCWGGADILTLNDKTIDELVSSMPTSRLAKSFRDAISVCGWLGYKYLWIDTLCIQQDLYEDWVAEANAMAEVYSHASLVIAAAHAENAYQGLFVRRVPLAVAAPLVRCSWACDGSPQWYYLVNGRIWESGIEHCKLSRRAWTVQERCLSSRTVYFSDQQIFYRCAKMDVCESFPVGVTPDQIEDSSVRSIHKNYEPRRLWSVIAAAYSKTALTKDTDKLVALAGVAEKLSLMLNDEYLVGLWRSNLVHELLWQGSGVGGIRSRPDPCLAPSWSWLSLKGVGVGHVSGSCDSQCEHHIEIVEAAVELVYPDNRYGDIVAESAYIQVRGRLKPASWSLKRRYCSTDWRRYQITINRADAGWAKIHDLDDTDLGLMHPDTIDPSIVWREIFLLPTVTGEDGRSECLVLTPKIKDAEVYERIGHIKCRKPEPKLFQRQVEKYGCDARLNAASATEEGSKWEDIPVQDVVLV